MDLGKSLPSQRNRLVTAAYYEQVYEQTYRHIATPDTEWEEHGRKTSGSASRIYLRQMDHGRYRFTLLSLVLPIVNIIPVMLCLENK
jgi:hypothetical protein